MDSKIIILNEELPDMHEKYNELRKGNASKNDDTPMCECHEANYIQSEEQTDRTDHPPPPQAHTEQVNAVFIGSGKSDNSSKIQTLPPIIVNNKTEKALAFSVGIPKVSQEQEKCASMKKKFCANLSYRSLSINIKKSHLLGVGIPSSQVLEAATSMGCSVMKAPFKYLGVTVGGNTSLVPKAVLNSMEAIRRNLFNGTQDNERKISWIKWAKIIHAIHGSNGQDLSVAHPSNWSSIVKEVNALKTQGIDIISHCQIRVGNGRSTRFWNDLWICDSCLCYKFPRLYALEVDKECNVAVKMNAPVTSSFRQAVSGGVESSQLSHILDILGSVILSNSEGRWIWDMNGDSEFRVKDVRNLLDEAFLPKADSPTRTAHEDLAHILFSCDLASEVTRSKGVLEGVFYTTWWSIWNFRNLLLFAAKKPRKEVIFDDIVMRSFTWCSARSKSTFRWDSWLQHPYLLFLFTNQPNETNMNDLESDGESVDTPLVSPFPHSDNDSDDGKVLNELIEYENVGMLCQKRAIKSFDGDDLEFQNFSLKNEEEIFIDAGDGVGIKPDGVASPVMQKFEFFKVIFDKKKLGRS
ncbi:hypothetical protein Tco_0861415 [Tanacetum coccineum]|uniref:RNA-directed DNA polymerase, eukaryota, reverse transcriptase zinc-binding domain protein n=1 Tax=Tanacetum coccineum TaxID=301880 RepID=A0ABQ5BLD3_9ASTR